MTTSAPVAPLSYADQSVGPVGSPTAAGFWIMAGGLGLISFGGCFWIGVVAMVNPDLFNGPRALPIPGPMTWPQRLVTFALVAIAVTCLVCGAWVMSLGIRKLLSVGR